MKLDKKILHKIISDSDFSRKLSEILGIKQNSVERSAKRALSGNSKPFSLMQPVAINFYKENGFNEEDIVGQESDDSIKSTS
ncbi:hypothetical protein [Bergeyella zoohelcum]|uniref:Uncharacterized protein n=2 Tax=Bergeyella zoohelcum TaxID=1015 RepID=K1LIM6_9FLAO|nr:hypothetical protein [Bergeyella zoohelcum]EKB56565.1 hypothetical protein HMPREF9699_01294 [Bergeyella zoohelcum ATCC 43767]SUV48527.1 Uncharacterised protein [Bergeyella zoohelcum]VDH05832.1 Uncharacterised protein [Bergeyella zoohelcum]